MSCPGIALLNCWFCQELKRTSDASVGLSVSCHLHYALRTSSKTFVYFCGLSFQDRRSLTRTVCLNHTVAHWALTFRPKWFCQLVLFCCTRCILCEFIWFSRRPLESPVELEIWGFPHGKGSRIGRLHHEHGSETSRPLGIAIQRWVAVARTAPPKSRSSLGTTRGKVEASEPGGGFLNATNEERPVFRRAL